MGEKKINFHDTSFVFYPKKRDSVGRVVARWRGVLFPTFEKKNMKNEVIKENSLFFSAQLILLHHSAIKMIKYF
jgi:hypothetical protein